jgi:hypothetical protein
MCQQAVGVVYSVTAIMSSVRSISDKMLSLVAFLVAGGVCAVAVFVVTVFAVGRLDQRMKWIKFLSMGRVGDMALIHARMAGLIRSSAWVTKNLSGTAQSTGRQPNVGGFCRSLLRGQVSAKPAEHEHRRKRAVFARTNGVDEGGNNATIFVALFDTTIFVASGIVSRETISSFPLYSV